MSNKHVISDLYQMQSLPLNAKISMTQRRIREWVDEYGEDGVYISFSGGKDSTVLLDIARKLYPNIKARPKEEKPENTAELSMPISKIIP